ncbi:hypothetical protein Y032_0388g500 [Ancylostoma ceylanicum]|uniref:Uncharacterized protein n=1 Tax=Ancylostoma ceylanicum TaxID=53326 RepID=A0A016RSG2_9BILA|nr:hypothetical protein Y032_0388g500 [Ancylostoma ceylanicum]
MNIQTAARGILRVFFDSLAPSASSGGYGSTIKGVGLRPVQNRAVLLKGRSTCKEEPVLMQTLNNTQVHLTHSMQNPKMLKVE